MTSPPIDDAETLRHILGRAEALFLDFDGPVCNLFAGLPASAVVDQLCVVLADGGYGDPPPEIEKSGDPFDVLKYAATLGQTEAEYVNAAFTAHEVEAIATAVPTPDAHEIIRAWSTTNRPIAIVSNNSRMAVESYLDLYDLQCYISHVSARTGADPALLKPSPYPIRAALTALETDPPGAVLVGDSISDMAAARGASVTFIGYANQPYKLTSFTDLSAAIVTSISQLLPFI